jgi:hypothetical protein
MDDMDNMDVMDMALQLSIPSIVHGRPFRP